MQPPPDNLGRFLIAIGAAIALVGVLLTFARGMRLGNLPGDLHWSGRGWQVWLPLGTSILLSLILTLVFNLFLRRR